MQWVSGALPHYQSEGGLNHVWTRPALRTVNDTTFVWQPFSEFWLYQFVSHSVNHNYFHLFKNAKTCRTAWEQGVQGCQRRQHLLYFTHCITGCCSKCLQQWSMINDGAAVFSPTWTPPCFLLIFDASSSAVETKWSGDSPNCLTLLKCTSSAFCCSAVSSNLVTSQVLPCLFDAGLRGRLPLFIQGFLQNRQFQVRLGSHMSIVLKCR